MMNKSSVVGLILFFMISYCVNGQSVIGKWKTIDDETGKAKSIVEIFEHSGKIYGRVIDILDPDRKKDLCHGCPGEEKNRPIIGLIIIKGLTKDGEEYNSGRIMDPKNGRHYKCSIALESKDRLKVRGYIGFALLGRTQYWHRVK